MRETVYSVGDSTKLVGVYTEGKSLHDANVKPPLVIILNSGLVARTGPFRLHVTLARKMSEMGISSFRFDLSGIGDSERHKNKRARGEQHFRDIQKVIDFFFSEKSINQFVVMGICTGADNAHRAMLRDNRIMGAVCIDGYTYPTFKYYFNNYFPKLFKLSSWKKFIVKRFLIISTKVISKTPQKDQIVSSDSRELEYRWELPPKEKTREDFQIFIKHDKKLLCIYTSDWDYNYSEQLADVFHSLDFGDNIELKYLRNAKHTFQILEDRQRLIESIHHWMQKHFLSVRKPLKEV